MADKGGPRRGSSLFSGPGAMGGATAGNGAPQQGGAPAADGGRAQKRNSAVLQMGPGGGIGFGIDFDSDYEDSDDEGVPHGGPHGGGRPGQQPGRGAPAGGFGPNHRPYVGGFAAAAYEAARSHHNQNATKGGKPQQATQEHNRPKGR